MKRQTRESLTDLVTFEHGPTVKNGVMVVKGFRSGLDLDRSLGTFPHVLLPHFSSVADLNQTLALLTNFLELVAGSQRLLSRFWEACVVDRHILDKTIDSARGEAAAAQAFWDVIQFLKKARSRDLIHKKHDGDGSYLSILTLPGGPNGAAYLLLDSMNQLSYRSLWLSKRRHVCLAPNRLQKDDIAVILLGGRYIYYLRPVDDKFEYIGFGFVSGFMNGEAFVDGWEDKVETFKLI